MTMRAEFTAVRFSIQFFWKSDFIRVKARSPDTPPHNTRAPDLDGRHHSRRDITVGVHASSLKTSISEHVIGSKGERRAR